MNDAIAIFVNFNNNHVYSFFITQFFIIVIVVIMF